MARYAAMHIQFPIKHKTPRLDSCSISRTCISKTKQKQELVSKNPVPIIQKEELNPTLKNNMRAVSENGDGDEVPIEAEDDLIDAHVESDLSNDMVASIQDLNHRHCRMSSPCFAAVTPNR
nr:hypothetical protein Itr_chr15CG02610 [Ipomoea trifida]